jgi:putative FmdB family regulatory protein
VPLYEYRCSSCGSCFELDCEPDERDAQAKCPHCGAVDVREMTTSFLCEPPAGWAGEPGG